MSIIEFKERVNLIANFVARMSEEAIPNDIKKTMVKAYANTLKIRLSDRMVDNFIGTADAGIPVGSLSHMAQS